MRWSAKPRSSAERLLKCNIPGYFPPKQKVSWLHYVLAASFGKPLHAQNPPCHAMSRLFTIIRVDRVLKGKTYVIRVKLIIWKGTRGRKPGKKGAEGVREAGKEGAESGRNCQFSLSRHQKINSKLLNNRG